MKTIFCLLVMMSAGLMSMAQSSDPGQNIIAVSPIQLLGTDLNDNEADVGINLSYERISRDGIFGVKIPFTFSLRSQYYYIMPTLKIYPFKQGPVKYAVGPQFYYGTGTIKHVTYNYNYPNQVRVESLEDRTQLGFMINNSVNFTIINNLYMSIDASLGINYYDTRNDDPTQEAYYNYYRYNSDFYPALQINFALGYRF